MTAGSYRVPCPSCSGVNIDLLHDAIKRLGLVGGDPDGPDPDFVNYWYNDCRMSYAVPNKIVEKLMSVASIETSHKPARVRWALSSGRRKSVGALYGRWLHPSRIASRDWKGTEPPLTQKDWLLKYHGILLKDG